jgi:predicted nuclease of predicted toxin-antitoxin system
MKLLCNECITPSTIELLLGLDCDAVSVDSVVGQGKTDTAVLNIAKDENRILLTYDKNGFQVRLDWTLMVGHPGVIVIRMPNYRLVEKHNRLRTIIESMKEDEFKERLLILRGDEYEVRSEQGTGMKHFYPSEEEMAHDS